MKREGAIVVDRLSELPEPIVDNILSLLPSTIEAIKTRVLSKTWWQRSCSCPLSTLKFDLKDFGEDLGFAHSQQIPWGSERQSRFNKFHDFVDHTMQRVLGEEETKLLKFKLVTSVLEFASTVPLINNWIDIALGKQVNEMELHVRTSHNVWYHLPETIFNSNSLETLSLGLQGMSISIAEIHMSSLRKLSLSSVRIDEQDFQNLITSCPLIENLRIFMCQKLINVKISGLQYLKEFEFCGSQKLITVEAPTLLIFHFLGYHTVNCDMNFRGGSNLETLRLQYFITEDKFHGLVSNFPSLKYLDLKDCYHLEGIKISSPSLQKLSIAGCKKLVKVEMDTPNLRLLVHENRNWSIPKFASATTVNLQETKFSLVWSEPVDDRWQ